VVLAINLAMFLSIVAMSSGICSVIAMTSGNRVHAGQSMQTKLSLVDRCTKHTVAAASWDVPHGLRYYGGR
jgi:hypothetical protein